MKSRSWLRASARCAALCEVGSRAAKLGRALLGVILLLGSTGCLAQANSPGAAGADSRIEHGRYLVNAGNCISCHTRPGGVPFTGGVAFDTPFGTIYSTNITPDGETGLGKWSVADLQRAMHEGIARDGSHLFPAFPYTSFTKVSDADVADIYAYLRTLRPAKYTPPANGVLLWMRWPLAAWNRLYFREGRFAVNPAKSDRVESRSLSRRGSRTLQCVSYAAQFVSGGAAGTGVCRRKSSR